MTISHTVSREEWLAARLDLLAKEKAASRQLAALAEQRRALPAVDNMPDPIHLNDGADTTLALVSRVPYARLSQFKARMGWRLPWYSSHGGDFNYDFHVSNDESIAPIEYNYKEYDTLVSEGLEYVATNGSDGQGVSVFVQDGGQVFHTYSAYGVGADVMLSTYRFLDLTPLGRQRYINEWPWHDTYGAPDRHEHHH